MIGSRSWEDRIIEERALILKIDEEFRRERTKYFAGVESEVCEAGIGGCCACAAS